MALLTIFEMNLSDILTILVICGGLIGVWIDARLRISALELKLKLHSEQQEKDFLQFGLDNDYLLNEVKNIMCEVKEMLKEQNDRRHELEISLQQLQIEHAKHSGNHNL